MDTKVTGAFVVVGEEEVVSTGAAPSAKEMTKTNKTEDEEAGRKKVEQQPSRRDKRKQKKSRKRKAGKTKSGGEERAKRKCYEQNEKLMCCNTRDNTPFSSRVGGLSSTA